MVLYYNEQNQFFVVKSLIQNIAVTSCTSKSWFTIAQTLVWMCKDFSLISVTNHHVAFILHVLLFKYKEWKCPEAHKMVQAFIIYTHWYNCVGKTGAAQIPVYFVHILCTHSTVTLSANFSCTSLKDTLEVLNSL